MNNNLINELYNKLDAQEDMIKSLQLDIIEYKKIIDIAIEIIKLCNSKCAKQTIQILKGEDNE